MCSVATNNWVFSDCKYSTILFFLHNFTTLVCSAVVRFVFVKSIKLVDFSWSKVKNDIKKGMSVQDGFNFSDEDEKFDSEEEALSPLPDKEQGGQKKKKKVGNGSGSSLSH